MKKIKVFKIWIDDAYMATVHKDGIIEEVKNQMENMDVEDDNEFDFTISLEEMDEKEYKELPEFEGF